MREKYCWLTENKQLKAQANMMYVSFILKNENFKNQFY
jgi:hypothetical protein